MDGLDNMLADTFQRRRSRLQITGFRLRVTSPGVLVIALLCLRPDGTPAKKDSMGGSTLYLGMLFGGWYLFNIYFNM